MFLQTYYIKSTYLSYTITFPHDYYHLKSPELAYHLFLLFQQK